MSKASPLTLTIILKAPTKGEEVEGTRTRKRATTELLRETAPVVEEELAQNRVERGKKRATHLDCSLC